MPEPIPVASIDSSVAKGIFERNIRNSQHIISGEFEVALADIIQQLEEPPRIGKNILPSMENVNRIARSLREGFAGLPPNGFEFSTWLWDVAPLHYIKIPQVNEEGIHQGYQIGFLHLRSIAAMTVEVFVEQQPQKIFSLVSLLDSSVGWLDAKNLVVNSMMSFYQRHFEDQYEQLVAFASETKQPHVKLIPLVVAARMIAIDPSYTQAGLELVTPTLDALDTKIVHDGISYVLKSAGMYGDQSMLSHYIQSQHILEDEKLIQVFCELLNTHRIHWSEQFLSNVSTAVESWTDYVDPKQHSWMNHALALVT
jgi:hypothetical protein